jgi:NADH:ubiquinone oxidoreductase subunit 6 (subunit J)
LNLDATVTDVVALALLDVDALLLPAAVHAIILLARTTVGTVTETMTARADVTGIALAALIIGTVSVTPRMTVMIVTDGRTVRMVTSVRLSTALLLLTTILTLPSRRLSDSKRFLVVSDQASQVKVSATCLGSASLPII